MKQKKKFDCVQMKWDIQQKIADEFKDISDEEANKIVMKRITENPILGSLVSKIRSSKSSVN
ncbi:MAG: hypothetical protein HQK91_03520 [Nitrospirae bacterium]|nr:hypothetical protein [Nitrospirota bacterium]MBF0540505.1 hypothetical protein [Nitrospirota bacterium]